MNSLQTLNPLIATLRTSVAVFEVQCEVTGRWISSANRPVSVFSDEMKKVEMRETLKKIEYQFHRIEEGNKYLTLISPAGYWLKDGRLVIDSCIEGERVKGYFGKQYEVEAMNRTIKFILDGEDSFLGPL